MSDGIHPTDALVDLVDRRLGPAERAEVEAHLAVCSECRAEVEQLTAVTRALSRLPQTDVPEDFATRLEGLIRAEPVPLTSAGIANAVTASSLVGDSGSASVGDVARQARTHARRRALSVGLAAAALLMVSVWWMRSGETAPESAADTTIAVRAGRLALTSSTGEATALNAELSEQVSFPVRVFDLAMMGYTIRGGRLHTVADAVSVLWVYANAAGELVCQMYRGSVDALPQPAEVRQARGFTFYVFHERGETQVFWQEGSVVCVLASNLPAEAVIELAIAKAMAP